MSCRSAAAFVMAIAGIFSAWACSGTHTAKMDPFQQEGPGFYQELSWSPDGRSLLVSVLELSDDEPGYRYRIWKLDADGQRAAPLTDGPRDYWTSWSPDGARIAFAALADAASLDIHVMNGDGSNRLRLTFEAGDDTQPAWSPDGRQIAFISHRTGTAQLWVMSADGADAKHLVRSSGEAQNPVWSPSGAQIAYYETDGQGDDHVMVVEADGSDPRRVAEGLWPSWTRDGKSVLYSGDGGLYRLPPGAASPQLMISGEVEAAELSPDGTRLAYVRQDSSRVTVVVSSAEGRNARELMTRPAPAW